MPDATALAGKHQIKPLPFDYGAAAAKYVDAFFQNVNWEEVDGRLERAEKLTGGQRR